MRMDGQKWTSFDGPTKDACVLKVAKDTQGIYSRGSSNDNKASDFSTPQFHAIND